MMTRPLAVTYADHMGSDLSVVDAARVSFAKRSSWPGEPGVLSLADTKLINYLAKHRHHSPFCHTSVSMRVRVPIFVARQLAKHQIGGTVSEESRRYISSEPTFYLPDQIRQSAANVKQGSGGPHDASDAWLHLMRAQIDHALEIYTEMIDRGVAAEHARMVLPMCTMTNWIWTGSLLFFARVYRLRSDPHAQQESREVAELIRNVVEPLFPVSWAALSEHPQ